MVTLRSLDPSSALAILMVAPDSCLGTEIKNIYIDECYCIVGILPDFVDFSSAPSYDTANQIVWNRHLVRLCTHVSTRGCLPRLESKNAPSQASRQTSCIKNADQSERGII